VFGDSHALMWAPALVETARAEGWRLVTYFKGGCPSLYIRSRGQVQLDGHRSCRIWRKRVVASLRARPPHLIVITNSDGYKMVDLRGKRIGQEHRARFWRAGLQTMLRLLPDESAVLVLGDVPQNEGDPIKCLRTNPHDMSVCATRRVPPRKRAIEAVERSVAASAGAQFRTFYEQVCSYDPCPLVHGGVLMWRDAGHLSATFARQLTPSMRRLLRDVVANIEALTDVAAVPASEDALVSPVPA
jgi:hypothetical protein